MNQAISPSLIEELDLGSARGARPGPELEIEVVRTLVEDDLPAIQAPPPVASAQTSLKTLRHSHHRLAELIVQGKPPGEISILTGYSTTYISCLGSDPAFAELLAYYSSQAKSVFVDAVERMKMVGIDAVEKLHDQLNDPSKTWSPRELMELTELMLVKPGRPQPGAPLGSGSAGAGPLVSVEVKFVGASPKEAPIVEASFTEIPTNN